MCIAGYSIKFSYNFISGTECDEKTSLSHITGVAPIERLSVPVKFMRIHCLHNLKPIAGTKNFNIHACIVFQKTTTRI